MLSYRPPIILPGQIYLNQEVNEYIVVVRNNRGTITYEGIGIRGMIDDEMLLDRFPPVDPADLEPHELAELQQFLADELKVGFIRDTVEYYEEEVAA